MSLCFILETSTSLRTAFVNFSGVVGMLASSFNSAVELEIFQIEGFSKTMGQMPRGFLRNAQIPVKFRAGQAFEIRRRR